MRRLIQNIILAFFLLFTGVSGLHAQTAGDAVPQVVIKKRQLLVQPRDAAGNIIMTSFWEDPVLWARDWQQSFYGSMNGSLRAMRVGNSSTAAWTLLLLGFGYGVFHAAGPGHGKVIISSWLLATENDLKRGLLVALMSSMFQALTAIILVSILFLFVASVGSVVRDVTGYLESASYAMISLLGFYMIWLALGSFVRQRKPNPDFKFEIVNPHFDKGHIHDENCGHAHAPSPQDMRVSDWSLTKAVSLSIAVGLRPCTGAILMLLSASTLGLYWAGIAATLAMGFGVFLTVALIATVTVYGKDFALRFAKGDQNRLQGAASALRVLGGLIIAFLGAIMFLGSFGHTAGLL